MAPAGAPEICQTSVLLTGTTLFIQDFLCLINCLFLFLTVGKLAIGESLFSDVLFIIQGEIAGIEIIEQIEKGKPCGKRRNLIRMVFLGCQEQLDVCIFPKRIFFRRCEKQNSGVVFLK